MKKTVILGLVFSAALSAVFGQEENAILQKISGSVEVRGSASSPWQKAVEGMLLPAGACVSTGFASSAELFISGTTLTIGSLSRFTVRIPKYINNVEVKNDDFEVKLPDGSFQDEITLDGVKSIAETPPIGTGANTRIKLEQRAREEGALFQSFDDMLRKSGFTPRTPEIPAGISVDVNVTYPEGEG